MELEPGIEGLIHVSEMSWTKKNVHPGKIVSTSQEVEVQILEVDPVKRRISLGLKQTLQNPWEAFSEKHPVGSEVEGEVKNKTEFGLFIGLEGDVDGMVHLSDLDWNRPGEQVIEEYKKGDVVRAQVLDVDVEKERISLGVKQLGGDPFAEAGEIKKGQIVTCEVVEVKDAGVEVKIADTDMQTFVRRAELARDRGDQRPERFAPGEKFDARVVQFDRKARRVQVSIKALEMAEEKEAMAQFGSADSGASLGDILGAASTRSAPTRTSPRRPPPGSAGRPRARRARPGSVPGGLRRSEGITPATGSGATRRRPRRATCPADPPISVKPLDPTKVWVQTGAACDSFDLSAPRPRGRARVVAEQQSEAGPRAGRARESTIAWPPTPNS